MHGNVCHGDGICVDAAVLCRSAGAGRLVFDLDLCILGAGGCGFHAAIHILTAASRAMWSVKSFAVVHIYLAFRSFDLGGVPYDSICGESIRVRFFAVEIVFGLWYDKIS